MTTVDSLAGRKAAVPAPAEPTPGQWEMRAAILLATLEGPLASGHGRQSFVAGWLCGVYRTGYWDAKLAEVCPDNPGPPPL